MIIFLHDLQTVMSHHSLDAVYWRTEGVWCL